MRSTTLLHASFCLKAIKLLTFFLLTLSSLQVAYSQCTNDVTPPVITPIAGNITFVLGPGGTRTISLSEVATIADNCNANPPYTISPTTFNCASSGQQTITVTATDGTFGSSRTPSAALFFNCYDLDFDAAGNLLIADYQNYTVRHLSSSGIVSTLAGTAGMQGYVNGTGANVQFNQAVRIAVDANGNGYLPDNTNQRIRKVTPAGVVTTYAGTGVDGYLDGPIASARFSYPNNITKDAFGNLYVVDNGNNRIRKITPAGMVSTFAGDGSCGDSGFCGIGAIGTDPAGNVYISKQNTIRKIAANGTMTLIAGSDIYGSADGAAASATFASPYDLTVDGAGNIWIADQTPNKIRKISPDGQVSSIVINSASHSAKGITLSPSGSIYFTTGNCIKELKQDGSLTVIAGDLNTFGSTDGNVGGGQSGNVSISQIPVTIIGQSTPVFTTTQANVSVPGAGGSNGCQGFIANYTSNAVATSSCGGSVTVTQLPAPGTLLTLGANTVTLKATDLSGNVASQTFIVTLIKVTPPNIIPKTDVMINLGPDGTKSITHFDVATVSDCGRSPLAIISPASFSCSDIGIRTVTVTATDGTFGSYTPGNVQFSDPIATAVDPSGNIFVADRNNFKIRKITPAGVVSTFVDGQSPSGTFGIITDLVSDNQGNIYFTDVTGAGSRIRKATPAGVVSLVAGNNVSAMVNGPAASASFYILGAITIAPDGTIYVADDHMIRKISTSGIVSNVAGDVISGFADGTGSAARFWNITGLATDATGNIYVADGTNAKIRKATPAGVVTTIAGSQFGFLDGPALSAQFGTIMGIAIDATNNIYVTDFNSKRIRKLSPAGVVTTIAGNGLDGTADGNATTATFNSPVGLALDAGLNLIVSEVYGYKIRKVSQSGNVSTIAGSGISGFQNGIVGGPTGNQISKQIQVTVRDITAPVLTTVSGNIVVELDATGNKTISGAGLFTVSDNCNTNPPVQISKLSFNCSDIGTNSITIKTTDGAFASVNTSAVKFNNPIATAVDAAGNIFVADRSNFKIRKISPAGMVSTFADGNPYGQEQDRKFSVLADMAIDNSGNILLADAVAAKVRKITPTGIITTLAGGPFGHIDGVGTAAGFTILSAITVGADGIIYVVDDQLIRKITPAGEVSTLAGSVAGYADGTGSSAKFWNPSGLATDAAGNIYVADGANYRVRKVSPSGVVTTIAGTGANGFLDGPASSAMFSFLHALVLDSDNNIYVSDPDNNRIRKITPAGMVSTFTGGGPVTGADGSATTSSLVGMTGLAIDANRNFYIPEVTSHKIRKSDAAGNVTTLAGSGEPGFQDGNIFTETTGNQSSSQITVIVRDLIAPVITCPADITIPSLSIHPDQTGRATATDNCPAGLVISYTDANSQSCVVLRTWKATDASGNFSSCVQTIAVPQMTVSLGQDMYILYGALGYNGCHLITPQISGGAGPYTYTWASTHAAVNGSTSSTITPCRNVEEAHSYTVTVLSANGCAATATVRLTYINISCSKNANNEKVELCVKPGNSGTCHTVCVSANAVATLIANGAYFGECLANCEIPVQDTRRTGNRIAGNQTGIGGNIQQTFIVNVLSNPTFTDFIIAVNSSSLERITIRMLDATGKQLETRTNVRVEQLVKMGRHYVAGIYFAEVTQGASRKVVKLVKQ